MFLAQCSLKYTFKHNTLFAQIHEKKKKEMKGMEISRTEKA